jgi:hypothetical protein
MLRIFHRINEYFYFYITGVYLRYGTVSEQLTAPKLERNVHSAQMTQDWRAVSCQEKYLIVIYFVWFQVWERTLASKDGLRPSSAVD